MDHVRLGNVMARKGTSDEAIASFRKAIELDPQCVFAHYNLGTALLEKKGALDEAVASYKQALACYREVIRIHPRDHTSVSDLAWLLVTCPHIPLRDPTEGVQLARQAVELAPKEGACWKSLGVAQYRARNWSDAVAALTKSVQFGGGDCYDYFFLAMAQWKLDEKEKARRSYDEAVRWIDKHQPPKSKVLGRFRSEAAELLQLESKKD
jgi:tetratricopeptide (TPR) repeat protein